MSLFALLGQLSLGETALTVVRVALAIAGAFLGWFVCDPLARIGYRLVAGKPIPSWSLPWIKIAGAVLIGLLIYFFLPLGGGPGGWGYGPGPSGGPGKGPGEGGPGKDAVTRDADKKATDKAPADAKDQARSTDKPPSTMVRKPVEIEVLGGKRYPGEERYYLLRPAGKAMTLREVEEYFKQNGGKLELHVLLTGESPASGLGIIEDLIRLADRYQIPTLRQEEKT